MQGVIIFRVARWNESPVEPGNRIGYRGKGWELFDATRADYQFVGVYIGFNLVALD